MKVIREYKGSHYYEEEFVKNNMFCPLCGQQSLWRQKGEGDYYNGVDYVCINCGATANLDSVHGPLDNEADIGVLEQLRSGEIKIPTTPKGR